MSAVKRTLTGLAMAAALCFTQSASASQVLADTGAGADFQGYYSSALRGWTVYDDFTLANAAAINHVSFYEGLTGSSPFNGSFTFSVYKYNGPQSVGSLVSSATINPDAYTAVQTGSGWGGNIYHVDFSMADMTLGAGHYFLSFYALGNMDFRAVGNSTSGNFIQYYGNTYQNTGAGDLGFRLEGNAVPEPGSVALFGLGLAGLLMAKRRKA